LLKTRASPSENVYRKVEQAPSSAEEFELPNGYKLAEDNRWVSLAQLIPWADLQLMSVAKERSKPWIRRRFGILLRENSDKPNEDLASNV
jgi:hypothetical protein